MLIDAIMLMNGFKSDNHQCKNAYICSKHSYLNMDWEFLETIRIKRNAINYEGVLLSYEDWNKYKINFDLHMGSLNKELDKNS